MAAMTSAPFDPFGERSQGAVGTQRQLLGGRFEFRSDSPELLALVDSAYRDLPALALPGTAPDFLVELRLTEGAEFAAAPPEPRMLGGAGFLGVVMDAANLALACPETRRGLVAISPGLLRRSAYHARYELLEFAVFTLASRALGLVPLHAGCVGAQGMAALLVGDSGAGKSTLALQALQLGLDFLTEDATFVAPQGLQAVGVANFLHLRFDAARWFDDALRRRIVASPVIRRRSGVEKYEIDLRGGWARLAAAPLRVGHVVFVTPTPADDAELLRQLDPAQLLPRLTQSQPYAAQLPSWPAFAAQCGRLQGHELRRGSHPRAAALALRALLTT
jgi:hypothetical protein